MAASDCCVYQVVMVPIGLCTDWEMPTQSPLASLSSASSASLSFREEMQKQKTVDVLLFLFAS